MKDSRLKNFTPMIKQYLQIKEQNKDAFLFYRLGDFYEMFFDDAEKASKLLDLVLTGRDCGNGRRAPMCGVPYHSVENYINRLISMGFKVAICEQMEDPATAKGLVKREIVRRITPGTLVESNMLEGDRNNFISAVWVDGDKAGLCFADISAGIMRATQFADSSIEERIINELAAYSPSEVVLGGKAVDNEALLKRLSELGVYTVSIQEPLEYDEARSRLLAQTGKNSESEFVPEGSEEVVLATGMLLGYLKETAMCELAHMCSLEYYSSKKYLELPWLTRRSLELAETMLHKTKKGSLLGIIDCTKTAPGSRLMRSWLEQPLYSIPAITRRLNAVEELYNDTVGRKELRSFLSGVYDLERLMGQIMYGSANGRTLVAISKSLSKMPDIRALLENRSSEELRNLHDSIDPLTDLCSLIERAIVDEPPFTLKEGGIIKSGYSEERDRLDYINTNGASLIAEMETRERLRTGFKNLKIGFNRVFGYYIEISKSFTGEIPSDYIRKQTIANGERYFTYELKELENSILQAREQMYALEYNIFCEVRDRVKQHSKEIMRTAAALSALDVLSSLAEVAAERGYTRPEIDLSGEIIIKDGRHPVVEALYNDIIFVPNDTDLDLKDNRLAVITGPNMAGKSTYMRQVALIVIMAQMGGFVPAKSAKIGLVDKIFTRVGASDELSAGRSTFMVEMSEMADILKNATPKSLLILDEIGRGTSTYDGLAIARAVLEYAASKRYLGAKTLFATHYHELTSLEREIEGVKNYNIVAKKRGEDIVFIRKIVPGSADESYGIQVAKLAGLPGKVISRAKTVLSELESNKKEEKSKRVPSREPEENENMQFSLTGTLKDEIISKLAGLSVETLTPLEALNLLYTLSKEAAEAM